MEVIISQLQRFGMSEEATQLTATWVAAALIAALSIIANFAAKKIVVRLLTHFIQRNDLKWGNFFVERKVFHRLSHLVPAIIIYLFAHVFQDYTIVIQKLAVTYMIVMSLVVINSFLNAVHDIYRMYEISKIRPIKSYVQVAKIVIFFIGGIIIISNLIGKSPLIILGGIGALSAVLMLIFQDSILGFVAGVQLTANDMVRVGDWIEMPKYGADGDVIDVSLNTVKVQNWDKTITTIPSYALISDSFKNWRGMHSSGGRRIKRSIYIDTNSIRFCTEEMIDKFKKIHYLTDYIHQKEEDIAQYNEKHNIDKSIKVNGRAMTNIGCFRAYITNYLKNHPGIHKEMTLMVRQLAPGEYGLPLEVYAFTNDTRWVVYESIQSDIFDHLFAVAPEFGLRIFQNPTGSDFSNFVQYSKEQQSS